MSDPRPLRVNGVGKITITVYGYGSHDAYLSVDAGHQAYGYIADKDLARLKSWVDECLAQYKKRRSKK